MHLLHRNQVFSLIFILLAVLVFSACSESGRLSRSKNIDDREKAALLMYQKKDYEKAVFLFEELLSIYKGTSKAENILYHYAWCKYNLNDNLTAAYYFNEFANQYPTSSRAEHCQFMYGYCYFRDSDPWYLDQSSTRKAIEYLQFYLRSNPGSSRVDSCNLLMGQMRDKLAKKSFEQANLYLKIGYNKSAVESFKHMMDEFPDSKFREEAQFKQFVAASKFAEESVPEKQKKRYLDAISYYRKFADKFPSSAFLKEAETYYIKVNKALDKITTAQGNTSNIIN